MILQSVDDNVVGIVAIISIFIGSPIVIAYARLIWKRTSEPRRERPAIQADQIIHRLEQLQQAVDTMSLEVERISEGQRFVTKLMSEKDRFALNPPASSPAGRGKAAG